MFSQRPVTMNVQLRRSEKMYFAPTELINNFEIVNL